ncbi:hypothetical protein BDV59DRAFT_188073 [Aspergillus ambiguus]|uniref:uncharacterized protein n=1 Tax=Aspergillus ambiguus TaxID=176160 RepID=UPI003CCE22FF
MPSPVAKGLIITVSALVAAGIAVYESPQFRQWVDNSRRKIAVALHHLGDEIQPRNASPLRQDISMTEEMGPEAEERRRIAREELQRRRSLLEEHRLRRKSSQPGTFDALVDENGNLLRTDSPDLETGGSAKSVANSTAVELSASQVVQRSGRPTDDGEASGAASDRDRLHISIPRAQSPTSTLVEYTPTSEAPEDGFSTSTLERSEVIYEHPGTSSNATGRDLKSPFSDLSDLHERPSTPSTASSFSHIYESAVDGSSDGTVSDLGRSTGAATPAWSEVGSVISNDDVHA